MLSDLQAPSTTGPAATASSGHSEGDPRIVYWHRELPPLDTESLGEHTVEADSIRVPGTIAHGDDLWDECYQDLMARAHVRLAQEVHRLGGDYAHVLQETNGTRHDYATGEAWLRGRFTYVLLKQAKKG
jgi:hypothetical protein